jgi:hypothetical protein
MSSVQNSTPIVLGSLANPNRNRLDLRRGLAITPQFPHVNPLLCSGLHLLHGSHCPLWQKSTVCRPGLVSSQSALLLQGVPFPAVGVRVGADVGAAVGVAVGARLGEAVGDGVGAAVGVAVGAGLGEAVGDGVGAYVGRFTQLVSRRP